MMGTPIRDLVDIYDRSVSEGGGGVFTSDLLRVAVVLLHASLMIFFAAWRNGSSLQPSPARLRRCLFPAHPTRAEGGLV